MLAIPHHNLKRNPWLSQTLNSLDPNKLSETHTEKRLVAGRICRDYLKPSNHLSETTHWLYESHPHRRAMRLKQVILTNFKSYKDETRIFIEDGTTLIVGENGAGKTNFLQAIDFVLGSRHADLNRLSRPRFINSSADSKEASVEIILQDDGKVFGEEVVIRRQFTFCSDRFYLNGSRIRRIDLSYAFEVLGFPRPTPYHITSSVQMKQLVMSNPSVRLNAFIDYLGLYISRTVSFLKKLLPDMETWNAKLNQIAQLLNNHEPKEIHAEAARHQKYSALKKKKSTIRFRISLLRIELWRAIKVDEANTLALRGTSTQSVHTLKCSITSTKLALDKSVSDVLSAKVLLDGLMLAKESLVKNIESVNLSINDMEDQVEVEELNISVGTVETEGDVKERITELENDLIIEQAAIEEIRKKLAEEEQKRNDLLLMLNTKDKLLSTEDKKLWIQDEIGKLKNAYEKNVEDIKRCGNRKHAVKNSIVVCENRIKQLDNEENGYQDLRKELTSVRHRLGEMQIEFHELNSHENVILNEIGVVMNSLISKKTELSCKIGNSTLNGMISVKSVRDSWNSTNRSFATGCYGTVLDNISCDAALNCALDAAAGNRLLSQIVETDTIGTAILREMKTGNMPGEVVFLPLNRILPLDFPVVSIDGVQPMINHLSFPSHIRVAVSHIFGRTLLCRDLEIATRVAKEFRCVCVTIHGDRVVGGGPMTGGFVDRNAAIRTLYLDYKTLEATRADKIGILQKSREDINVLKCNIDSLVSFTQRGEIRTMNGDYATTRKILMSQLENLKKDVNHWTEQIKVKERDNGVLLKKKEALEKSFHDDMTNDEAQRQLQAFNKNAFELEKAFNQRSANLDLLLSEMNLLKNKVSCSVQKAAIKVATSSKTKAINQRLNDYRTKEKLLSSRLRAVDEEIIQASSNLASASQKVEELKSVLENQKQRLFQANLSAAGLDTSRVRDAIKEYDEKIKKEEKVMTLEAKNTDKKLLGELAGHPLEELQNLLADTTRDLHIVAKTLKVSPKVLKKEIKYVKLWEIFDGIKDYHVPLCAMVTKFHSWVQQHVSMSLEQVCNLFTDYFSMMAASGRGSLHVERSATEPVLAITGIRARLHFSGESNVSLPSALSTGQQVVVFLAMVFALMNSQKPCFCILDEIDQCLTTDCVDGLLSALSDPLLQNNQFLISSHNIRMISRGQHHFAINYKRGKSTILAVTRTEAVHLVEAFGDTLRPPSASVTISSSPSMIQSQSRTDSFSSQQSTASDLWRP